MNTTQPGNNDAAETVTDPNKYWKFKPFKIDHYYRLFLNKAFGIKLPKLKDQKDYWAGRGHSYMRDFLESGFEEREIFFQNLLLDTLRELDFSSCFEAGCGFGWNVRRIKEAYPAVRVGGLDFSLGQLMSSSQYLTGHDVEVSQGDNRAMPFADNAFDVGFSVGVFMNIHQECIDDAIREMIRVCGKYIIHLEYDEDNASDELRDKRSIKTNIVSHDYKKLYEAHGQKIIKFSTYRDFGGAFDEHMKKVNRELSRWEGFEGPDKYIIIVVETTGNTA